jgi:hypothetical protein
MIRQGNSAIKKRKPPIVQSSFRLGRKGNGLKRKQEHALARLGISRLFFSEKEQEGQAPTESLDCFGIGVASGQRTQDAATANRQTTQPDRHDGAKPRAE